MARLSRSGPAALALLAACAVPDDRTESRASPDPASFAQTAWRIDAVNGRRVRHEPENCPVTLSFNKDGTFGGQSAINGYGARYRMVDGLVTAAGIEADAMGALDPAVTKAETDLFAILSKPFALKEVGGRMLLVDGAGRTRLRLDPFDGERCAHIR